MSATRRNMFWVNHTLGEDDMPTTLDGPPLPETAPDESATEPAPSHGSNRRVESLDNFFAGLYDQSLGHLAGDAPAPPSPPAPAPVPALSPEHAAETRVQAEWLAEERERLDQFTTKHFAMLQRQREELAAFQSQIEANLVTREQELNRQGKLLAAHRELLEQREQKLAQQEANLAAQSEKLATVAAEVAALQETRERVRQDIEVLCGRLEQSRIETQQVEQAKCTAQSEVDALAELREEHQRKWQVEQAEGKERLRQMEQRAQVLEKAEHSLRIRSGEIDELEFQIRQELEQHEQRLIRDKQDLEQRRQQLLGQQQEKDVLRAKLGAQSQEVERLRKQLTTQNGEVTQLRAELARHKEELEHVRIKLGAQRSRQGVKEIVSHW